MSSGGFFKYDGQNFDLSSQRWRKRCGFMHELELIDQRIYPFFCRIGVEECVSEEFVFCQADITFNRNLEEILYHLQITKASSDYRTFLCFSSLIEKWKNGKDAWNNPIGENIKGE